MVKLDNWETKASRAAERRTATKQRKQERVRKRSNKQQAQNLLALLDHYGEKILAQPSSLVEIHIWTDSIPTDSLLDQEQKVPDARTNPFVTPPSTPSTPADHGRRKSKSGTEPSSSNSGRKNGRPRGLSDASEYSDYGEGECPSLCCSHFFSGTCSGLERKSRKKGKGNQQCCTYGIHLGGDNVSLYQALQPANGETDNKKGEAVVRDGLAASRDAVEKSQTDLSTMNSQMDMLYHLSVVMRGNSDKSLAEAVSCKLSSQGCSIASIVYLVMDLVIIYDRYRDGIVVSANDEEILLRNCVGEGLKRRSVSIGDYPDKNEFCDPNILAHHQNLVRNLPSQVLEYLVLFLPDTAVAMLPLVCKSWNKEIGRSSPDLWKKLLKRRCWPDSFGKRPLPADTIKNEDGERDFYRNVFISHYMATRNLSALVLGLEILELGTRSKATSAASASANLDLALLHFKDSTHKAGNTIVQIFSPACALVANCDDCTLSLFDTAETSSQSFKRCRRNLSVSVAPFSVSKKKICRLVAMDIDHDLICCMYHCGSVEDPRTWLGLIEREDLLCAESGGVTASKLDEGVLQSFDLQSMVLNHLLVCDDDEVSGWLYSHLMMGDEIDLSSVEIDIKTSLVACGNGQFLFEAAIVLPLAFDEDNDDMDLMSSALLKIFLFSADSGEITWVGPSGISGASTMQFWYPLKTSIVGNKMSFLEANSDHSGQCTEAAFISRISADVATIHVHSTGEVQCIKVGRNGTTDTLAYEGSIWRRSPEYGRAAVVTSSDIVVAECCQSQEGLQHKTVFSFFPTDPESSESGQLTVHGNCMCFPIESIKDDYILAFSQSQLPGASSQKELHAILIHVWSRRVIHKICLDNLCSLIDDKDKLSFSAASHFNSLAVVSRSGLFLVGQDVKSVTTKSDTKQKHQRTGKKKKKARSNGKKDAFARGMRQSLA